jgi:ribosome biogenesis GTPase
VPSGTGGEPAGVLIDTPGLRELQLWDSSDTAADTFADVEVLASGCRFRDCRHDQEPGCSVRAAVADGRFDASRLEGFLKLARERAALGDRQDELSRDTGRQGQLGARAMRQRKRTRNR